LPLQPSIPPANAQPESSSKHSADYGTARASAVRTLHADVPAYEHDGHEPKTELFEGVRDELTNAHLRRVKFKSLDGLCVVPGCTKRVRSRGHCKSHGGGKRCDVDGCTRSSQRGGRCIRHGGGSRCEEEGCTKAAQLTGRCKAHGGGVRCQVVGCEKSSQGNGFCRQHGGGQRCGLQGCEKGAQRNGFCATHGGSVTCRIDGCTKNDRGGGFCAKHGGGKRCKFADCSEPARYQGKCSRHANSANKNQAFTTAYRSLGFTWSSTNSEPIRDDGSDPSLAQRGLT
uniref:WRKY19-like zinc finger domain-containing protein n=1 Tax=Globisporangium ultimum (strain ATCC 200006 / CBS 805.95 / DAOM BR144) TaxID=431595 RepID=K3X006_GLOUD